MSGVGAEPAGPGLGFRPGLDGLRAVAVLAVIAYHLGAPWMRGGFLGVDLFMVLSGYLITGVLLLEVERDGGVSLRRFWSRRVRRILPAVLALLVGLALYAWLLATPAERAALRWDALASLTSWANWRFIADGSGYWAQFGPPSPLTHMWSLAVEEQFYLVWPVVVAAVAATVGGAQRRRVLLWLAGGGAAASALAMVLLHDPAFVSRVYLGTDTRVQTLLVGALGALVLQPGRHRPPLDGRVVRLVGPVAAVGVVIALVFADDRSTWLYRGGITAFAVVALVAVVAAGERGGPLARGLGLRPLVWVGQRSYALYLWHWPLIVLLTPARLGIDGPARVAVILLATFVAAAVSYRLVEQPARGAGNRGPALRLPIAVAGSVALTATALVLATGVAAPDRPELRVTDLATPALEPPRTPEPPEPSAATGATEPVGADGSELPAGGFPGPGDIVLAGADPVAAADTSAPPARPVRRVLLQGDSVAIFSALPLGEALSATGVELDDRTFPGQTISNPDVLEAVEQSGADLSIWYVSMWDVGDPDELRAHHERFVSASLDAGSDVVFVDRPPVDQSLETAERQAARRIAAEVAAAHPDDVHFLDPTPVWGTELRIDADGDGLPERMVDGVHVCPQGAARWTAWFLEELSVHYPDVTPPDPTAWLDGRWLDDPHWAANPGQCDRRSPTGL